MGDARRSSLIASPAVSGADAEDLTEALHRYFGFSSFRAGQDEIVQRAVEGRNTLAIMPTGAGKSLCYQLAAMLRLRPTVVISPLIALMKDQIDNLPETIRPHATLINSSLDTAEVSQRLAALVSGQYRLVYVAPERLRQRRFLEALRAAGIGLVVIDEVHCVSMWGHDFRPDYLFLRTALQALDNPPVLGMTATATARTAHDIAESLGRQFDVVRSSVVRPNLRYEVRFVDNEDERLRASLSLARKHDGAGIIYARSREKCESIAHLLRKNGIGAQHYHAGLEASERVRVQEAFTTGISRVIVATTAFGMGIDKPDIRWVLLYNYPNSLESYVQMVGRAGRDGAPSTCMLLAGTADAANVRRYARSDLPSIEQLRGVYRVLRAAAVENEVEIAADDVVAALGLDGDSDARVLVGMLERAGLLRRGFDAGRAMRIELVQPPPADTAARIDALLQQYESEARGRGERMIAFAEAESCRHQGVAEHFGEQVPVPCGRCDVCDPQEPVRSRAPARALPDDIGRAIIDAVAGLTWPLGMRGLSATLKGAIDAPPSAQHSPGFGVLAGAPLASIKRWIGELGESGHLHAFESEDGYRLLRLEKRTDIPSINAPGRGGGSRSPDKTNRPGSRVEPIVLEPEGAALFERLRTWRWELAQEHQVPAYTVLPDRTLREIAARRPTTADQLGGIHGVGPAKLQQYGEQLLALVHAAHN